MVTCETAQDWMEFDDDQCQQPRLTIKSQRGAQTGDRYRPVHATETIQDIEAQLHEIQDSMNEISILNQNNNGFNVHDGANIQQMLTSVKLKQIKSESLGKLSLKNTPNASPVPAKDSKKRGEGQHQSTDAKAFVSKQDKADLREMRKLSLVKKSGSLNVEDEQRLSYENGLKRKYTMQDAK